MSEAAHKREGISLGIAYSFRGFVYFYRGRKHGSMQSVTRTAAESYIPTYRQGKGQQDIHALVLTFETSKPTSLTYFLLQDHSS